MAEKLDILAFGAHPDDVELSASGTLKKHCEMGYSIGIVDLTEGELGTRGSAQLRYVEAAKAGEILGLSYRTNLQLKDGFFEINEESLHKVIVEIRKCQPEIVFCNALSDRHPDHGRGGDLVSRACFLSGLPKIQTTDGNAPQEAWRPKVVYRYIQDRYIKPDIVVDISAHIETKREAILAYSSQFYSPGSNEPETPISSKDFFEYIFSKDRAFGRQIGVSFAEGFNVERTPGIENLFNLL